MPGQRIGVEATPRALEFPALIEATTTNPDFEIALYGFSWDATFIQDAMFGCDQYQVGFNDMKYCNPELDEINDQAKRTFDEEARRELLIQASNIVNDEQPVGILLFSQGHAAYSDRLQNYIPSTWGSRSAATSGSSSSRRVMGSIRVLGDAEDRDSYSLSPYHPVTLSPSYAFMYTRKTRLRWGCLPFATGDQAMSVLVVPVNISFQARPDGGRR